MPAAFRPMKNLSENSTWTRKMAYATAKPDRSSRRASDPLKVNPKIIAFMDRNFIDWRARLLALKRYRLEMARWKVKLYVDKSGRCPFEDDWLVSQAITVKDKAKIDARLESIESIDVDLPPKWWTRYRSSDGLWELRVTSLGKKMLRPLGIRSGTRELLLFYGSVEKNNQLDRTDLKKAERLKSARENGKGTTKRWKK